MNPGNPWLQRSAVLTSLLVSAAGSLAGTCVVPGPYPTLSAAIADPDCASISVGEGEFFAGEAISRSVVISGAGPGVTSIGGPAGDAVFNVTANGNLNLMDLAVLTPTISNLAITTQAGGLLEMDNVVVTTGVVNPPAEDELFCSGFETGETGMCQS